MPSAKQRDLDPCIYSLNSVESRNHCLVPPCLRRYYITLLRKGGLLATAITLQSYAAQNLGISHGRSARMDGRGVVFDRLGSRAK